MANRQLKIEQNINIGGAIASALKLRFTSEMVLSLPVVAALFAASYYLFWRIFGPYFVTLPIDNLLGPTSQSWLWGT